MPVRAEMVGLAGVSGDICSDVLLLFLRAVVVAAKLDAPWQSGFAGSPAGLASLFSPWGMV